MVPTNAGPGGCCCHLVLSCWNGPEGLVPELSLGFCATGLDGVQVRWVFVGSLMKVVEDQLSDQIRLMSKQLVAIDVEQCGLDVVAFVF